MSWTREPRVRASSWTMVTRSDRVVAKKEEEGEMLKEKERRELRRKSEMARKDTRDQEGVDRLLRDIAKNKAAQEAADTLRANDLARARDDLRRKGAQELSKECAKGIAAQKLLEARAAEEKSLAKASEESRAADLEQDRREVAEAAKRRGMKEEAVKQEAKVEVVLAEERRMEEERKKANVSDKAVEMTPGEREMEGRFSWVRRQAEKGGWTASDLADAVETIQQVEWSEKVS